MQARFRSQMVSVFAGRSSDATRRSLALFVAAIATITAAGCATTGAGSDALQADTRAIAFDESSANTHALSSTQPSSSSSASSSRAQGSRAVVTCDTSVEMPLVRCAQCPSEPTRVAVARSFDAAEASVQRCVRQRRSAALSLRVLAEFASAGVPLSFDVRGPGVDPSEEQCLRTALCTMRVPTFRTPSAIVRFEYGASE